MKFLNEEAILESWIVRGLGLEQYSTIMNDLDAKGANDPIFRKTFISFYKVIFRAPTWIENYFQYMQKNKNNKDLEFGEVLNKISGNEGNIEVSFASKLLHTINPNKPVWDQFILEKLHINKELEGKDRDEKIEDAINKYQQLEDKYEMILSESNSKTQEYLDFFDKLVPSYKNISKVKKLDFLFWSIRDKNTSKYFELKDDIFEDSI